ncbi:MAG: transcriptional regulator HexR, partial [Succinivibrio sp.]
MANILDRIAAETDLTKSERKLADIILKDPAAVVGENIAQLAKRAGVSDPSVCRFCRRFGANGFP